ncbi:hypothetical protein GQ55_6G061900 [Panicum hallii var. hallii]|uniref:Uncharacterized protein n=1 Tax=Panicum hallii var. hallii TaxID=1504633 RepID=A0A2T7D4G4_9POAL|nr:hypothetical protein GQ55_6G061900 [Panicum hallii var. hallii]
MPTSPSAWPRRRAQIPWRRRPQPTGAADTSLGGRPPPRGSACLPRCRPGPGDEHGSHSDGDLDSRGAAAAREGGRPPPLVSVCLPQHRLGRRDKRGSRGDGCRRYGGQRGEQQGPSRGALSPRHHKHTIVVHPSACGVDAHPAARCNLPMRRERWWPWRNSWAPSSHHLDCRRALCPLLWPPIVLTVCFPVPPTCLTKCTLHIDKILCIEHQQSATCIHL